jgi:ribokinase
VSVLDPTRPSRVTERLLALCDHVMPDADETRRLTGIAVESRFNALRAARELRMRGPRHVHVRLPRGGCLTLWPEGEALISRPTGIEAVDTTGAGDAFAGTLAACIVAGRAPLDSVRHAVAAAAGAVSTLGAQRSYPGPQQLEATARGLRVSPVDAPSGAR